MIWYIIGAIVIISIINSIIIDNAEFKSACDNCKHRNECDDRSKNVIECTPHYKKERCM